MSALFNFHSFVTVVLLLICTCTYLTMHFPSLLIRRTGFRGFFWKAARIGNLYLFCSVSCCSIFREMYPVLQMMHFPFTCLTVCFLKGCAVSYLMLQIGWC
ncbi:hypothetical protein PVAP13_9KG136585 [Panicum virgatum]|uniref:Protein kish n=1 Tax=Panicum virgatum TaxID=38727 RepID=A0A8T0NFY7_PANVG|nr:hypothetical protein PVAP13_9KG136585 [Panicum virgatum]